MIIYELNNVTAIGQSELGTVTSCAQVEATSSFLAQNGSSVTFEVL